MNRSFRLLTIRGIDIRLHITFPLILLWAAIQFGAITGSAEGAIFGVIAVTILFVLVTLHELGHSFVALYYGVPVEQIVLSPIGGVAQLRNMPDKPWQEFAIAVAGPAVNVLVGALMLVVAVIAGINVLSPQLLWASVGVLAVPALFSYIFASNLFLAAFNLIPAFPLDGGRIFRALLAMRLDYVQATNIAAAVGRVAAVLLGIYGLFNGGFFMILIALFIFFAAGQEASYVKMRQTLRDLTVQQVFSPSAHRLAPTQTLEQAYNMMIYSGQSSFPVTLGETLIGFLSRASVLQALRSQKPYVWIESIMRRDVPAIAPDASLYDAQQVMVEAQSDALPVVAQGRYVGMITQSRINELYRWLQAHPSGVVASPG
jgi:Zn-dependent protease/CBS domain-containing protein